VTVSPRGVVHEAAVRLEYECTNNQTEYEPLVAGLEALLDMKAQNVEAYGDSQLVVNQILGESQCFDGVLNQYLERCMQLIGKLDTFRIEHMRREENEAANKLVQQVSRYMVTRGRFSMMGRPISYNILGADGSVEAETGDAAVEDWRTAI
jgi:ribonuclease HI